MKYFILFFLILLSSSIQSQNYYILRGELSKIGEGKIFLIANSAYKEYYDDNRTYDSSVIKDGKFMFRLPYKSLNSHHTYAYRLEIVSNNFDGVTGIVLLDNNDQNIEIDIIDPYTSPVIENSANQNEVKRSFEPYFKSLIEIVKNRNNADAKTISRKEIELRADSLLLAYIRANNNSYVALWKLIERFESFGYKAIYKNSFESLTQSIQKSSIGNVLYNNLKISQRTSIGQSFPYIKELKDTNLKNVDLNTTEFVKGSDFTLIDFWFSTCIPCLQQFKELKDIDSLFKSKIKIVGLSIDKAEKTSRWKSVILEYSLPWSNLLDESGKVTSSLLINKFPSNFLVDNQGIIIKKNISPQELKSFLGSFYLYDKLKEPF